MASQLSETILLLRHAGMRRELSLPQIDQLLESHQLMKRMGDAAAANERDGNQKPGGSWWKPDGDTARGARQQARPPARKVPNVFSISHAARVVTTICQMPEEEFISCLQILSRGSWTTVVCYEFRRGHSRRYLYHADGEIQPFEMDLPAAVVAEMSSEDFKRNWAEYARDFQRELDSVKADKRK